MSPGGKRRLTWTLVVVTAVVLAMSIPGSLRDAWERGGIYLFSREFLPDLARRLTGPGRFRFVMQPAIATALGIAVPTAKQWWAYARAWLTVELVPELAEGRANPLPKRIRK